MPKTSPIVIVLNADDKFAMPLAVTLYSALINLRATRAALIYIIDGGISEENRQKFTEVLNVKNVAVQLEWVKPDTSVLSGLKTTRWYNETIYFRLLVPELLPKQLEWNVMVSTFELYGRFYNMSKVKIQQMQEELRRKAFILHFSGPFKPWHSIYPDDPKQA